MKATYVTRFPNENGNILPINLEEQKEKKHPRYISPIWYTFDIETTTRSDGSSFMYHWQMARCDGLYTYGRTWESFLACLEDIRVVGMVTDIFVHNLTFEWSFMSSRVEFTELRWLDAWKLARADCVGFSFRDTLVLFNDSLKGATKGMEHAKLAGDLDYNVYRDKYTELTETELQYCVNDVVGLVEALNKRMDDFGDTIITLPMTSTGYVRREVRAARDASGYEFTDRLDTLRMLKQAFRGGNTHANRKYTGHILEEVESYDRSSSYPDILVNERFPIGELKPCNDTELSEDYAYLMRVRLDSLELKEGVTVPYIPSYLLQEATNLYGNDNGRPLFIGHALLWVTDIDYRIICKQYTGAIRILDRYRAPYGYLPDWFRDVVNHYYNGKTSLKGVTGAETEYSKCKALLNSLYGMAVTDPLKPDIEFTEADMAFRKVERRQKSNEIKPVLPYQWGVWCTAWARERLQRGIDAMGDAFVYCDTDSIKGIKQKLPDNFKLWLEDFNNTCIASDLKTGAHAATPKGIEKYMGCFEYEETYKQFVTQGAKKYCVREEDGSLHMTLSGVPKRCVNQLNDDISNFRDGMLFKSCKLTPVRYIGGNDSYTTLKETDYLMSTETEYLTLLDNRKRI